MNEEHQATNCTSSTISAGLGIDLQADSNIELKSNSRPSSQKKSSPIKSNLGNSNDVLEPKSWGHSTVRSMRGIDIDTCIPGGSLKDITSSLHALEQHEVNLSRQGTLLTAGATADRNAAELKSILGNANARLKPGATVLSSAGTLDNESITLEQAKARARVDVDIILENNTFVQGNYVRGHVKIHVRKRTKKEGLVLISGGKVRILGFECILNESQRFTFYQQSESLSAVSPDVESMYESDYDLDGFAQAREGVHILPFALYLPLSGDCGVPKGTSHVETGALASLRYIAMISVRVKEPETGKKSIAHFYRKCEVWPRLEPSIVLAPAPRPLQSTIFKNLSTGGTGKVRLTASLHRLHWIAGQRCFVKVNVVNETKKTLRNLSLSLLRSTIIFKPKAHLDALPASNKYNPDPDACQTSTTTKQVAESILQLGKHATKGHASAKGWWTGVDPGETLDFMHSILIPPDALSITRGRLIEVEYNIRVSLGTGSLLSSGIQVTVPIRILNFLSIDPLPSDKNDPPPEEQVPCDIEHPVGSGMNSENLTKSEQVHRNNSDQYIENGDVSFSENFYECCGESVSQEFCQDYNRSIGGEEDVTNSLLQETAGDISQPAIAAVSSGHECAENAPRFADLYYLSLEPAPHLVTEDILDPETKPPQHAQYTQDENKDSEAHQTPPRPKQLRMSSSFVRRVDEKRRMIAAGNLETCPGSLDPILVGNGKDGGSHDITEQGNIEDGHGQAMTTSRSTDNNVSKSHAEEHEPTRAPTYLPAAHFSIPGAPRRVVCSGAEDTGVFARELPLFPRKCVLSKVSSSGSSSSPEHDSANSSADTFPHTLPKDLPIMSVSATTMSAGGLSVRDKIRELEERAARMASG